MSPGPVKPAVSMEETGVGNCVLTIAVFPFADGSEGGAGTYGMQAHNVNINRNGVNVFNIGFSL